MALLGGLSLGLVLGFMTATYSAIQIVDSFNIGDITIDINETQLVQSSYEYLCKYESSEYCLNKTDVLSNSQK